MYPVIILAVLALTSLCGFCGLDSKEKAGDPLFFAVVANPMSKVAADEIA